jgi:5'-nucleotidase/UDP-sugar diphosphatase
MNWKVLLLAIALVGMVVAGLLIRVGDGDQPFELTILHTNDLHAHYDSFERSGEPVLGGVARLKAVVDDIRDEADNVLFLDAGDQFQGTLFFTVGGAEVVADVMNELEYDAMCVGNHEFDAGPGELATLIDRVDFPVLSANIDASADSDLSGAILPYEIFVFGREPVAVIGLTTEHTAIASSPGPDVQFLDAIAAAQRAVHGLEERGIDVIVALTHLGYERDLELAGSVDGIDVIVGGHSHTLLDPYPTLTASASGEPVLVITAYEWGSHLSAGSRSCSPTTASSTRTRGGWCSSTRRSPRTTGCSMFLPSTARRSTR